MNSIKHKIDEAKIVIGSNSIRFWVILELVQAGGINKKVLRFKGLKPAVMGTAVTRSTAVMRTLLLFLNYVPSTYDSTDLLYGFHAATKENDPKSYANLLVDNLTKEIVARSCIAPEIRREQIEQYN